MHCIVETSSSIIFIPSIAIPISSPPLPFTLLVLRKSSRPHHPLAYLKKYSYNSVSFKFASSLPYDISDDLSYSHLGTTFHYFIMAVTTTPLEPSFFHQAVKSSDWRASMDKEIVTLELNNSWTLTSLPPNKFLIG